MSSLGWKRGDIYHLLVDVENNEASQLAEESRDALYDHETRLIGHVSHASFNVVHESAPRIHEPVNSISLKRRGKESILGLEVRIRPADSGWMATNRDRLAAKIQALPSFVTEKAPGELWLRGASSTSTWPYDVRLFLEPASLLIEISTRGEALSRDVASIHADVAREVPVSFEDEGDPDEIVDSELLFRAPRS